MLHNISLLIGPFLPHLETSTATAQWGTFQQKVIWKKTGSRKCTCPFEKNDSPESPFPSMDAVKAICAHRLGKKEQHVVNDFVLKLINKLM